MTKVSSAEGKEKKKLSSLEGNWEFSGKGWLWDEQRQENVHYEIYLDTKKKKVILKEIKDGK